VLDQLRRRKWNRLGTPVFQWTLQWYRERGRPKNTCRRDVEKEMWTAGF